MSVLECAHISKAYRKKQVLRDITFSVSGGEIIGICGDNGSGKSTLLSVIAGVTRPDDGKVMIDGQDIRHLKNLAGYIGYMPQSDPLPAGMSVRECLDLWCNGKDRLERIAADYDLESIFKVRAGSLSGGMKRRLSFACAAASDPDVLVLDEPTAALDEHYGSLIKNDILKMSREGKCIILVSHDREEIGMCNICYRITDGINEKIETVNAMA